VEGLSRAIKIFRGDMDIDAPVYTLVPPENTSATTMTVHKTNTDQIRPFVVCAMWYVRSSGIFLLTRKGTSPSSFIDFQDQLHRNLCRLRTLVAIATNGRLGFHSTALFL
jgi:phenylalanyl-tRNA synthetase beta chain